MTHAIDRAVVERAAEAVSDDLVNRALVIASCREPVGAGDGNTYVMSVPTLETMRRAIEFVLSARPAPTRRETAMTDERSNDVPPSCQPLHWRGKRGVAEKSTLTTIFAQKYAVSVFSC
jgi:hypothetical protein